MFANHILWSLHEKLRLNFFASELHLTDNLRTGNKYHSKYLLARWKATPNIVRSNPVHGDMIVVKTMLCVLFSHGMGLLDKDLNGLDVTALFGSGGRKRNWLPTSVIQSSGWFVRSLLNRVNIELSTMYWSLRNDLIPGINFRTDSVTFFLQGTHRSGRKANVWSNLLSEDRRAQRFKNTNL